MKITPDQIENLITTEVYFTAADGVFGATFPANPGDPSAPAPCPASFQHVTICVLMLDNGHKVVGVNEGPLDPAEFDAEVGKRFARQKALDQLWPLLGFQCRENALIGSWLDVHDTDRAEARLTLGVGLPLPPTNG